MTEERHPPLVAVSDLVAERVKELRQRGGWMSTKAFAERCAEVGAPQLSASVLMNIESGRRKDGQRSRTISVDELLALAAALDVSPLALLLPRSEVEYPVTPTLRAAAEDVYAWIIARRQSLNADDATGYTTDPLDEAEEDIAAWWKFKRDVPWVRERGDVSQLRRIQDYLDRVKANELVTLLGTTFVPGSPEPDERFRRIAFPALRDLTHAKTFDDFQAVWDRLTEQLRAADAAQIATVTDDETRVTLAHLKDLVTAQDKIARSIGDVAKPEVREGEMNGPTEGVQGHQEQTGS